MGSGQKDPLQFSLYNFSKRKNASPKLLNLNQDHPSKKTVFLVKSVKNWGYDNFSHENARAIKPWSHDHIYIIIWITWYNFFDDVMDRNYDVITFVQKTLILRRPGVAIFADIDKIVTTFIKTILKYSRKVRKIRSYVSKWNLYLYFLT